MSDREDDGTDEFDAYGADQGDDGEDEFAAYGEPQAESAQPAPAAAPAREPSGMDYLLALADGATLGNLKNVQGLLPKSPAEQYDPDAQFAGPRGMADQIPQDAWGKGAQMAGRVLPYGLATQLPGGPVVQGAVTGGLEAMGRGESIIGGAATGAALGGLGGLVAGGLGKLAGPAMRGGIPSTGTRAAQVAESLSSVIPGKYAGLANRALEPGLEMLGKMAPGIGALGVAGAGTLGGLLGDEVADTFVPPASAQDANPRSSEMRSAPFGSMPAESRGIELEIGPARINRWQVEPATDAQIRPQWDVRMGEAQLRDSPQSARNAWAVESVLYQGTSGLPPDAEQQLTEAALSGSPEKLATTTFLLSGRYPGFSAALQKQRDSLLREED